MEKRISEVKPLYFRSLQGLRFVLAIFIFVHHVRIFFENGKFHFLFISLYHFYSAVTGFFVLSGFILINKYYRSNKGISDFSAGKFYMRRLRQIYPLHLVTLLLSISLVTANSNYPFILLYNLFLVQSFIPNAEYYFYFNALSWFLSALFFLYLVFPAILLFLDKIKRSLLWKIILLWVLTSFYTFAYFILSKNSPDFHWSFYISPLVRIIDFLAGIITGLIFMYLCRSNRRFHPLLHRPVEIAVFTLLAAVFYFAKLIPLKLSLDLYFIPFFSLLIIFLAWGKGIIGPLLSSKMMVHLGDISFPFLMFHWLVMTYFVKFNFYISFSSPFVTIAKIFIMTLFFSELYHHLSRGKKIIQVVVNRFLIYIREI